MKKLIFSVLILITSILTNSCSNTTAGGETVVEKADTPGCSLITHEGPENSTKPGFVESEPVWIKTADNRNLKIVIAKNYDELLSGFFIQFSGDTMLCGEHGRNVIFTFEDGSQFKLINYRPDNCKGDLGVTFSNIGNSISVEEADNDLRKITTNRVRSIRVETHHGDTDYIFTDVETTNFMYTIDCVYNAKAN